MHTLSPNEKKNLYQLMVQGKAPVQVEHGKREQQMHSGEGEETQRHGDKENIDQRRVAFI